MKKYGNVVFTEKGVEMSINYGGEMESPYTQEQKQDALDCAVDYLHARMQHCIENLNVNVVNATFVSESLVCWKGGHFSRPVYDLMNKAIMAKSWNELDKAQIQQVIRALHFNHVEKYWGESKTRAFNIATEMLLCM